MMPNFSWPGADLAKWVFLLLLLIANTEVRAEDFTWTTNNGLITITSYIGPAGTVTIPERITGLPVTAIGTFAFQNRANLTSIASPGGLTSIGDYAFEDCARLVSFTMPDSVTNLGIAGFEGCSRLQSVTLSTNLTSLPNDAFNGCSNLTSIVVPNSVTNIGARAFLSCGILTSATVGSGALYIDLSAFDGCALLIAITVDPLNNSYSSVDGVLFNKDQTTLLLFPEGKIVSNYIVPASVTTIGPKAFYNCTDLLGVTLGNRVSKISNQAFAFCSGLTDLTIPDGVTTIEDGEIVTGGAQGAFLGCTGLTNVVIGNGVTNIGDYAFVECSGLARVTFGTNVTTLGQSAFAYCTSLARVVIPDKVANLQDGNSAIGVAGAFSTCTRLTSVVIGNSVTNIGDNAFFECSSLYSIIIPDNVVRVGQNAFSDCASLTNVTIGSGVTNLVDFFPGCPLPGINVNPANSTYSSVAGVLFNKAQTVLIRYPPIKSGNYTVPDGVISLLQGAFAGCSRMPSITIPDSVTDIGDSAFGYTLLKSVAIGNGVTNIGSWAFNDCANLSNLTIPGSVTRIGDAALAQCAKLTGLYFKGNAPSLGMDVLGGDNTTVYYLPGTSGWSSTFAGRPTALWNPQVLTSDASFGVGRNGFGFNIAGTANIPLVLEASTNFAARVWVPLQNCTLTNGLIYFSDPQWTSYSSRFYRIRSP